MKKEFVPYELALKLKELGFDNKSLGFSYMKFNCEGVSNGSFEKVVPNYLYNSYDLICTAPLWQQAFDWFREKYNLHCVIDEYENPKSWGYLVNNEDLDEAFSFKTYEKARQACLEKLIELCENNQYHLK